MTTLPRSVERFRRTDISALPLTGTSFLTELAARTATSACWTR